MSEIKVRLSMEVPGATMLSSQDCEKMSKKDAYKSFTVTVTNMVKKGKKTQKEVENYHISVRNSKPAKHSIAISKDAYYYMIDAKEIPDATVRKAWGSMSKKQRLEYHLSQIAENFDALSFSYEILDD